MAPTPPRRVIAGAQASGAQSVQGVAKQADTAIAGLYKVIESRIGKTPPTVSGSRASGAAALSLLSVLASIGLVIDESTP